ncbi:MAG TPA: hypothetical protein VD969_27620 [Symbiobacteriaceae bacterium]|nr:hypothetical protein [Symbiobacteriaceae bacterium]
MFFLFMLGTVVIERRRLRQLLPVGLVGLILTGIHIGLPEHFRYLVLTDTGPVAQDVPLTLLIQVVGGPVGAMWFAQGLGPTRSAAFVRIGQFSLVSLAFWWMAVEAGRVIWWGPVWQFGFSLTWYTVIWRVHLYMQSHTQSAQHDTFGA